MRTRWVTRRPEETTRRPIRTASTTSAARSGSSTRTTKSSREPTRSPIATSTAGSSTPHQRRTTPSTTTSDAGGLATLAVFGGSLAGNSRLGAVAEPAGRVIHGHRHRLIAVVHGHPHRAHVAVGAIDEFADAGHRIEALATRRP